MPIMQIESSKDFNKLVKSSKPTIAFFSALWIEECKRIFDILLDISFKYIYLEIIIVPAEELLDISEKYQVDDLPTVIIFRNNQTESRINGYHILELAELCKSYAKKTMEYRLDDIINKPKIMVFLRGSKKRPTCPYSKILVEVLNKTGVAYNTFNILKDAEVREGLKAYWPSFPQVYVNGVLKGGLTIIKQLSKKGELVETLQA